MFVTTHRLVDLFLKYANKSDLRKVGLDVNSNSLTSRQLSKDSFKKIQELIKEESLSSLLLKLKKDNGVSLIHYNNLGSDKPAKVLFQLERIFTETFMEKERSISNGSRYSFGEVEEAINYLNLILENFEILFAELKKEKILELEEERDRINTQIEKLK